MTVDREGLARVILEATGPVLGWDETSEDCRETCRIEADACLAYICEQAGGVGELVARLRDGVGNGWNHEVDAADRTMDDAADTITTLSAALALVTRERDEARSIADECGRTALAEMRKREVEGEGLSGALQEARLGWHRSIAKVFALTAENERLREAGRYMVRVADFWKAEATHWSREKAGDVTLFVPIGSEIADEASARAALTPGRGADEIEEAGGA